MKLKYSETIKIINWKIYIKLYQINKVDNKKCLSISSQKRCCKGYVWGHGNFHPGDYGLDLFVVEDIVIMGGSRSNKIDLRLCEKSHINQIWV